MSRSKVALVVAAGLATLAWLGCATDGWERARTEDTPAAYHRFLDESPRSPHAAEAQERLEYLAAKRDPRPQIVEAFLTAHPGSPLAAELESLLESRAFEAARTDGSAAAYRQFLQRFPDGADSARARGNAEYLEHDGFAGRPGQLADFVARHPESDYAAEARRTLALLDARSRDALRSVGLRIEIESALDDADRLRRVFTERAQDAYSTAGVRLMTGAASHASGWLTIRHSERAVPTQVYQGRVEGAGVLAETRVTLERAGESQPIWSETFTLRVSDREHRGHGSVLFSPSGPDYWSHFFVPVARWATQTARREELPLTHRAVAVAVELDRAVALFGDGSFHEIDLSDPSQPRLIGEYARPRDLAGFSGVYLVGPYVVVFGEDGLEVVRRNGGTPKRLRALSRGQVGAVVGVAVAGDQLWIASSQGLLRTALAGGPVATLVPRSLHGLAIEAGTVYVADDRFVYAAPAADPRPERFQRVLDLGRTLDPQGLRLDAGLLVVLGDRGLIVARVAGSGAARPLARWKSSEVGQVSDAAIVGSRIFLLGERGLQVVDAQGDRVVDSVDVAGRIAVGASGRHLVVVGDRALQVVDASPWTATGSPAALRQ